MSTKTNTRHKLPENIEHDWDGNDVPPSRPRGDVPRERTCISCSEPFMSEGWHNRLCPRCRRRSDPFG